MKTLVLIPTYNERENLPPLVADVLAIPSTEVLVIDDQSPDGTGTLAEELAAHYPGRVRVMHRTGRRGLGVSYLDGFEGQMSQQYGQPFAFNERPLGLRRLTVVAFLQDDATHEVLQTAVLPIERDIELPALAARSSDALAPVAKEADDAENTGGPKFAPQE